MVCWISDKILLFVSKFVEISPEAKDVYRYGIEITISSALNILLILLCSLALGDVLAGITYLFIFIYLRSFTGGYHADTYLKCNIIMVVTFVITFILYRSVVYFAFSFLGLGIVSAVNIIPIALYSPIPNIHKPLTDVQCKRFYKLSLLIAFMISVIGLTLYIIGLPIGAMFITTVTMVSALIIIEIFIRRREYHEG